jgi:16S rRNA U516 pseudouridylate synthase RsuA-like enzyme
MLCLQLSASGAMTVKPCAISWMFLSMFIGRLDYGSEGMVLMTNYGGYANYYSIQP